jgi:hypothetical protein
MQSLGKVEELKDFIVQKEKENKIIVNSPEGLKEATINEFIKQPLEGILYDLNRLPEVILSTAKDNRFWVNDYAMMVVVKRLFELIDWEKVKRSNQ